MRDASKMAAIASRWLVAGVAAILSLSSHAEQQRPFLSGTVMLATLNDAPERFDVPAEWQQALHELTAETKVSQREQAACVLYGRTEQQQNDLAAQMVKLS